MAEERDPSFSGQVSAKYRELGAEEPSRALDEAILAAGRRGASARPASLDRAQRRRWYAPLATAAILVLGVAVSLHVQQEKPDAGAPESKPAAPAAASIAESDAKLRMESELRLRSTAPTPAPAPEAERKRKAAEPAPVAKGFAPDPAPVAAAPPASSPVLRPDDARSAGDTRSAGALARLQAEDRTARDARAAERAPAYGPLEAQAQKRGEEQVASAQAPAPAAAPARPAAAPPATSSPAPALMKEEGAGNRAQQPKATADMAIGSGLVLPERELERIGELRRQGKHDEADKALEAFRKRYPHFKFSDEMLKRVERP